MLTIGQNFPQVRLPTQDDPLVDLAALRPAPFVLFAYSEDGSETCTLEALAFSQAAAEFAAIGVRLFGLSRDSAETHAKFARKQKLAIPLLSDISGEACEALGIWQEKKLFGRIYVGVIRSTFLVDGKGRLARLWTNVRLKGHVAEVLAAARAL